MGDPRPCRGRNARRALGWAGHVLVVGVVLLGGAGCASSSGPTADSDPELVATDPPLVAPATPGDTSAPAQDTVQVLVTATGWNEQDGAVEVSAIVTGVVEDGGECVLVVSQGAVSAEARTTAVADASSTSCGLLAVADPSLVPGVAEITIRYLGSGGSAASTTSTVEIP